MARVSLKNVSKRYDNGFEAVNDVDIEIDDKEFVVLVGPSGCGKSTTLRMIAGLEEVSKGQIKIEDRVVNDVEPKDRDIAMVFQNYALYPHMSVYENMAFGLKLRKNSKSEIRERVESAARILEIEDLLERKPKQLSGGQRQRVALGRAIVRDPKVFLMDEPLSNLDAKLRVQMRSEIIKLHKRLNTTFVYVTHDQTEAMTMGDRIVVMDSGKVQQVASPQEIYDYPENAFVARFIGSPQMNIIRCEVVETRDCVRLRFGKNIFSIGEEDGHILKSGGYAGKEVLLGIRPENVRFSDGQEDSITVTVDVAEHLGSETYLYSKCEDESIVLRVSPGTAAGIGEQKLISIDTGKMHLFDAQTGKRI